MSRLQKETIEMPRKDPEKRREYYQNNKEQKREYQRNYRKINNPNVRRYNNLYHYYDFETHRELAMSSGIQSQREWIECHKMGLVPDGIYRNPYQAFRRQ